MQKVKRILAIIGVIFLVTLYLMTLIAALTASENKTGYFMASIYATIVIPVLIWAYSFFYKLFHKKDDVLDETPSIEDKKEEK